MSEPFIEYREEFNINDIARKYAERVARVIDEQTLANVENRLAEFGYVKVVRCRDCIFATGILEQLVCKVPCGDETASRAWCNPNGFCAWGERRDA